MLKRARISVLIAAISALFGFTGLLDGAAIIAQVVFYAFATSALLSFLFSMFEEGPESRQQIGIRHHS